MLQWESQLLQVQFLTCAYLITEGFYVQLHYWLLFSEYLVFEPYQAIECNSKVSLLLCHFFSPIYKLQSYSPLIVQCCV